MSTPLKSLQILTKKSLSTLTNYLDPKHPKNIISFNPIKQSLNFINGRFQDYNSYGKKHLRYWGAGILGMLLGAVTHYTDDIQTFFTVSVKQRYIFEREVLMKTMTKAASEAIDQHVLKNQKVMTELQKLLYEICTTLNVIHLAAENISKVLKLQGLNQDINGLIRQLLIQTVFKNLAEQKLKQLIVLLLRNEQHREFIGQAIMDYFNGQDFNRLIRTLFKELLESNAFQQVLDNNAKSIIKGSLTNTEFKQMVFNGVKNFLYANK